TTLASNSNPSTYGGAVTFTATVSASSGTPTGKVSFFDDGTLLATKTLDASGTASFTTSSLLVGDHPITAFYSGDANDASSTGTLTQTITPATLTITVDAGQGKTYGDVDSMLTFTPSGFVNGDDAGILSGNL